VEYASKAVENSGTAIGLRVKDGIVLAVEKLVQSKLLVPGANKRIASVDLHAGVVSHSRWRAGRGGAGRGGRWRGPWCFVCLEGSLAGEPRRGGWEWISWEGEGAGADALGLDGRQQQVYSRMDVM
jgi:hypothetical protein